MSQKPKGMLPPEMQRLLDGIERDLKEIIVRMSPEELDAYIEDERQEATAEQFADFMKLVHEVARSKSN